MNFLDLIKSDGYITVSKELARKIGLQETILLSELISQHKYFKQRNELDKEGYFYCTVDKMEKQTTISKKTQTRKINNLVEMGLIEKKLKGLPAKRHFNINEQKILDLFLDKNSDNPRHVQKGQKALTREDKNKQQEGSKRTSIHNNKYNNKTEEEDARVHEKKKIPDKIKQKFDQVFNRELSVELYEKMLKIYSDQKILFKALKVAEEKGDKPCYVLEILSDWQNKGLTSVSSINTYLKERATQKQNKQLNKPSSKNIDKSKVPNRSLDEMYEDGWR
mgnify:FL=1